MKLIRERIEANRYHHGKNSAEYYHLRDYSIDNDFPHPVYLPLSDFNTLPVLWISETTETSILAFE